MEAMPPALRLRPFRPADRPAALAAHDALVADNFSFLLDYSPGESWAGYLARLDDHRRGVGVPADRVPSTFLAAVTGVELVGRVSIRHQLNEFLETLGGHIGYAVVPARRRRGYATEILRQSLVVARSLGIDRVLVTCDDDNVGSATVIERCGGVLESVVPDPGGGAPKRRYWID